MPGRTIIFRVDANEQIGMGHLMRCIALAQEFVVRGYRPLYVLSAANENVQHILDSYGFEYVASGATANSQEDSNFTLSQSRVNNALLIVCDGYAFKQDWFNSLSLAGQKLLLWTDYLQCDHFPVDMILDQTPEDKRHLYQQASGPGTVILSGPQYIVLRDDFLRLSHLRRCRNKVDRILVSMGGADPANATGLVLESIRDKFPDINFEIVIGHVNPRKNEIEQLARELSGASVHSAVSNMAALIASCDLAISASGISVWEYAYMGLPAITICLAENQRGIASVMEALGCTINMGDSALLREQEIASTVDQLVHQPAMLSAMSNTMMDLVDGLGRKRVVESVETLLS